MGKQPLPSLTMLKVAMAFLSVATARKSHGNEKRKHAHTYLQFCADDTSVSSHACVHRVPNKWPLAALLSEECKEAQSPYSAVGSTDPTCLDLQGKDLYHPITIPMGLRHPNIDYRTGADTDTFTDWDRIRCRDGQLFATGCGATCFEPVCLLLLQRPWPLPLTQM